ncbi:MAG: hypothetical protein ABW168_21155, partial [Sedimenticola sp.]
CQVSGELLYTIMEQSYGSIVEAIGCRHDDVSNRLESDINPKDVFFVKTPKWHKTCRATWTSKRNLTFTRKRKLSPSSPPCGGMTTRNSTADFDFKSMCVLCGKSKLSGKNKHAKLTRVEYDSAPQTIYNCAKITHDQDILHRIEGDNNKPLDLFALEARYHKLCHTNLKNKARPLKESNPYDAYDIAFNKLCCEIESPLLSGKIMYLSKIRETFANYLLAEGMLPDDVKMYRNEKLKRRLQSRYGESILFWPQTGKTSDIVCSSSLSAGKLISTCMDLKQDMDENFIPLPSDDTDEVMSVNDNSAERENQDKVMYDAALRVSTDLRNAKLDYKTNTNYLSIDYDEASKITQNSLYNLIAFILCPDTDLDSVDNETGRVNFPPNTENKGIMSLHERVLNLTVSLLRKRALKHRSMSV